MLVREWSELLIEDKSQFVPRYGGKQMMHCLELQTPVEEIHDRVALHVCGGQEGLHDPGGARLALSQLVQLLLREGLHREVRDADLDVQNSHCGVRQEEGSHHLSATELKLHSAQQHNFPRPKYG